MSKKAKKYAFSLNCTNLNIIEQKYLGSYLIDNIPLNTTKIDDIEEKKIENICFLDESKKLIKCNISMIDFETRKNLSEMKKYKCFWCKNYIPSNVYPIGCPIKYIPDKATKNYHSEINKEKYTIVENITNEKTKQLNEIGDEKISIERRNYYLSDGLFCSFNCCMAYIQDNENKNISLYRYSESLLLKIYSEITEKQNVEILPAPHWRTLIDFGGHLTIDQFRDTFNKSNFTYHGTKFFSLANLYEQQIKF